MRMLKDTAVLALLGAIAAQVQAQGNVEIYGLVGAYAGAIKRSGETRAVDSVNGGGLTTSFLGFRGQEALGDGVKAIFALESFYRTDTGEQGRSTADPLFSRNAWVGLESRLGRLTLGRQTNPTYALMSRLSPFGSSVVFSPLALQTFVTAYGGTILGDSVWNNTVQYSSPVVGGFTANAIYGPGEQPGRAGVANLGLHGAYSSGKFMAAVSFQRLRMNIAVPLAVEQKAWLAGANYDFGLFKVYGNGVHTDIDGGAASRMGDAGVSVPLGVRSALLAEVARTRALRPGVADVWRTTSTVGYDYRLSKRTDLYALYVFDKKSRSPSAGSTALGIRHLF